MPEISCKNIVSNSFPPQATTKKKNPTCPRMHWPRYPQTPLSDLGFSSRRKARPPSSNDSERPEIDVRLTKVFYFSTQRFSLVYCSGVNFDFMGSRKGEGKVFILFIHNLCSVKVVLVLVSVFMCQK